MDLASLAEAVDRLAASDPGALSSGEALVVLERQRARLEAIAARAAARFEAEESYAADGARNAAAWLSTRTHLPRAQVRAELRLGRTLRELPRFDEALRSGFIGAAHVRLVGRLLTARAREAILEAEDLLVTEATRRTFSEFERLVAYLAQLADPDGTEEAAEARRARRDVWLVPALDGYLGRIDLDPFGGAVVEGELRRLSEEAYASDRAEAGDRLGREPCSSELARTPAQRRADALVEMARRSAALGSEARGAPPLVSVLVDFPTMSGRVCELANGMVVSPGSLLPYLDDALVERAVWHSPSRIEVGAKVRLFSGATRRAIEIRDRVCQHPYCEEGVERCQVDHIVPAAEGGETTQENGRLLCSFHNRLRNVRPELPPLPPLPDPPWTAPSGREPPRPRDQDPWAPVSGEDTSAANTS